MLFYQPAISEGALFLDEEESRHAIKVLRLAIGDLFEVTDGQGNLYSVRMSSVSSGKCGFEILQTVAQPQKPYRISIAIAPTKNSDRTEWFVEKAVELGIDDILFFFSAKSERKLVPLGRMRKKAISAMKQSGQVWLPAIHDIAPLAQVLGIEGVDEKFIAHVDTNNPLHLKTAARPRSSYLVLIGPEGDFTEEEIGQAVRQGFRKVSLGPTRLRTETAGVAACALLNILNH